MCICAHCADTADRERVLVGVRQSVCHRAGSGAEYGSRESQQRAVTGGEAATAARPPSSHKSAGMARLAGQPTCSLSPNSLIFHPFDLYRMGLGRPGHGRIQKAAFECSDRPFFAPPRPPKPTVCFFQTAHHLPVTKCKQACDKLDTCTTPADPRPPFPLSTILSLNSTNWSAPS